MKQKREFLGGWGNAENGQKVVFIPPWTEQTGGVQRISQCVGTWSSSGWQQPLDSSVFNLLTPKAGCKSLPPNGQLRGSRNLQAVWLQ